MHTHVYGEISKIKCQLSSINFICSAELLLLLLSVFVSVFTSIYLIVLVTALSSCFKSLTLTSVFLVHLSRRLMVSL